MTVYNTLAPVVALVEAESKDEAIRLLNTVLDNTYGLAGYYGPVGGPGDSDPSIPWAFADDDLGEDAEIITAETAAVVSAQTEVDRLRAGIQGAIDALTEASACTFRFCPGPGSERVPMATCNVCDAIIGLRELLGGPE